MKFMRIDAYISGVNIDTVPIGPIDINLEYVESISGKSVRTGTVIGDLYALNLFNGKTYYTTQQCWERIQDYIGLQNRSEDARNHDAWQNHIHGRTIERGSM